jgi:4-hydroxybenzoate polyprenyltransferase
VVVTAPAPDRPGALGALRRTLEMIRFSHSVFALPFALLALVASRERWPSAPLLGWVLLAMVAARSAAMAVNRIADRRFDAENPRTAGRHLVTGALGTPFAVGFMLVCVGLFFLAAWRLGPLPLRLSPIVLVVLMGYSFLKRFTALAHLGVGLALGLAPLGAWVAARGTLDDLGFPSLLAAAVTCWVAGFDVVYACQDVEVDRRLGLHSLPALVGVPTALRIAALLHVLCVLLFGALVLWGLTPAWPVALALSALLLARAHGLARSEGIGPANAALMPLNGLVAVLLGAAGILDVLLFA